MKAQKQSVAAEVYDSRYYLELMEGKESFSGGKIEERFYEALRLSDLSEDMSVLDLGTGRGEMAVLCAKAGAKVDAGDYSRDSIKIAKEYAQKNLSRSEMERVKFQVMNAKNLSFSDQLFDRVFFLETLEHLYAEEINLVLLGIRRVLKPEGVLILSTGPNALLVKPLLCLGGFITGRKSWESRKYHVNEQNFFGLKKLLINSGFRPLIQIRHSKNWLYGQICNQDMSSFVKTLVKRVNAICDADIIYALRRLPLVDIFLGTHFLCFCKKN